MAVRFAVTSGSWSTGSIWDNGAVPVDGDDVYANGYKIKTGRYCYRHTGTSSFVNYYNKKGDSITKEKFYAVVNPVVTISK